MPAAIVNCRAANEAAFPFGRCLQGPAATRNSPSIRSLAAVPSDGAGTLFDSRQNAIERPSRTGGNQDAYRAGTRYGPVRIFPQMRSRTEPAVRFPEQAARQPSPNGLILTAVGATTRRPGGHLAIRAGPHFYPAARCRPGQGRNRCWPPTGELHVPLPNRRQGALSIAPANATPDCPPEHRAIGGSGRHWSQACGSNPRVRRPANSVIAGASLPPQADPAGRCPRTGSSSEHPSATNPLE